MGLKPKRLLHQPRRFRYIKGWYNPHRRHSVLDYQSPVSHEMKYLAA